MDDLIWLFKSGPISVEQLGGGLSKLNFAVHAPEGFFVWQLTAQDIDQPKLELVEKLSAHLRRRGLVTRQLVSGSLRKLNQSAFRWSIVYRGIPGRSLRWSEYSLAQIEAAVKYLTQIHLAGRDFPNRDKFVRTDWQWRAISQQKISGDWPGYRVKTETLEKNLRRLNILMKERDAETVLHGDYGRANIIFHEDQVVGVVDFDLSAVGHPAVDLGRLASYLLLDTAHSRPAILDVIRRNYTAWPIMAGDLEAAMQWAWFSDWLSWRSTPSEIGKNLTRKLVTEQLISKI